VPRAAAKSSDRLVCRACKLPIAGTTDRRAVVWLGIGPLHEACHAAMREAVARTIADALAAGTHAAGPQFHVCSRCGEWRAIWYRTLDRKDLCRDCTPEDKR
jgi:hypothetical protein